MEPPLYDNPFWIRLLVSNGALASNTLKRREGYELMAYKLIAHEPLAFLSSFNFMSVERCLLVKYFRIQGYGLNINIFYFHNPFCSNKNQCRC